MRGRLSITAKPSFPKPPPSAQIPPPTTYQTDDLTENGYKPAHAA